MLKPVVPMRGLNNLSQGNTNAENNRTNVNVDLASCLWRMQMAVSTIRASIQVT